MTWKLIIPGGLVLLAAVAAWPHRRPETVAAWRHETPATAALSPRQGSGWQAGATAAAAQSSWIKVKNEMVASDGVTHHCTANVGPVVTLASGASVRPVFMCSFYLHTSGGFFAIADTCDLVAASGNAAVSHGGGPFAGESSAGVAWNGVGTKMADLAPAPGKTWATVQGPADLQLNLYVQQ